MGWSTCQVALLNIAGKAACFAFAPCEQPAQARWQLLRACGAKEQRVAHAEDEPKPTNLPEARSCERPARMVPEISELDEDEMEFRILRLNDCEARGPAFEAFGGNLCLLNGLEA